MIHGGRVCVASEKIDAPARIRDFPANPGCVLFALNDADADAAIHAATSAQPEPGLIWAGPGGVLAASIALDGSGSVLRDAEFPAGSLPLIIHAGASVEDGPVDGQYVIRGPITFAGCHNLGSR